MNLTTNHTQYMSDLVNSVMNQMSALYCREDFLEKLHWITDLQKRGSSALAFHREELKSMCKACSLNPEYVLNRETRDAELASLPQRHVIAAELFKHMYRIWKEFPTSQQVMERVTRRLLAGRFADDSLRMAIVKQFLDKTDYGTETVLDLACQQLTEDEIRQWHTLPEIQRRSYLIDHLKESIFDVLDAPPQWTELLNWVHFLLDQLKQYPTEDFRFSQELAMSVCELLPLYPRRTEPEYLLQSLLDDDCCQDEQRLDAIIAQIRLELARFLKDFPYQKRPSGKTCTLKDKFIQSAKDFKKKNVQDFSLLQLAQDLSEGRFYSDGRTKEQLYLYAVAFDMKAYFGLPGEIYDPHRDLVKNLFHDYYNDNLLRYILNPAYLSDRNAQEAEPSGEGINFKNFKEVIYLYYLTAEPDLSTQVRMRKIQSMINGCSQRAKTYGEHITEPAREKTAFFQNQFLREVLPLKKRKALQDYLCAHYYIAQPVTDRTPRMLRSPSGNTAREQYRSLTTLMLRRYSDGMGTINDGYQMNNGLELRRLLDSLEQQTAQDQELNDILHEEENKPFLTLLWKLEETLHTSKKRVLRFQENTDSMALRCSRTELVTLYYCYFYFYLTLERQDDDTLMSLPQLFNTFRQGADVYLSESGYQCISPKNIYDVFAVFALYLEQLRDRQARGSFEGMI